MKVLIAEDELEVSSLLKDLIEESFGGVEITVTSNGLDGFLACLNTKYNLIITDHEMPFMKGAALVIALRTRENLNKGTSIVMLSAFINDQMKKDLGLTNIEFVNKPFNNDDLVNLIAPYLI
ncbi:MAG: response regulator [Halobacteriovoraceae bacterium]|nr:response regulator [Halobacteriovoraceae bacterium]